MAVVKEYDLIELAQKHMSKEFLLWGIYLNTPVTLPVRPVSALPDLSSSRQVAVSYK